ncbi:MAG: hypothetical protein ACK5PP_00545 [Acidimicrobiales bacterium]
MTIEKGRAWGELSDHEPDTVAAGDAALAALADTARRSGRAATLAVEGGDVLTTLGIDGLRPVGERMAFPVDLGQVRLDGGEPVPFVAHLVARRRAWRGEFAVVMNAAWLGPRYLGPRAHLNDGLLDVTVGSLAARQLVLARRRAVTGTHLPHPGLTTRRVAGWEHDFPRPVGVWADGRRIGSARSIRVEVIPDCFILVA